MVGYIYIYLTICHGVTVILRGGRGLNLGGWGGDVDLMKAKSLTLGFERLYLPSRLRNSLTYLSFTKEIEIHAHKRVIMMLFVCLFYLAFFLSFLWFLPLFVSLYMLRHFFFVMVFLITCSHVYVYCLIAV